MPSTSNPKLKTLRYKSYQPIPQTLGSNMDNAVAARNTNIVDNPLDQIGGGTLPTTYSSQQLMPASDSDSIEDGDRLADGVTQITGFVPANVTRITQSQWFTVGVLCFVNLINYMDRFTIAGVLDDIQDDFKLGDDSGGLLQTVFVFSYMICAPIFGYLGDRYSRKWIMSVGVLLWSTTTLLGSFMNNFGWFITFRALVGIGEASYSTIAPTIISDLFVHDLRSKMLAMFYFAIPVGSGFGYIAGSQMAYLGNDWRWALRVTPVLGIAAVVLLSLINEPERGESEGSHNLLHTSYSEDIKHLVKNKSFMLSTAGFTCVAFVTGALAWWAPKFIYLGLKMQPDNKNLSQNDVSYKFGMITMLSGLIGVPLGSFLAQRLKAKIENCDPYICAAGLLVSAPLVYLSLVLPQTSATLCFLFVFGAQVALNLCWSIVADILLYVVVPTRRSTAEAFQILISHALGDAGSPFLVGVLSETIKNHLRKSAHSASELISTGSLQSLSLTLAHIYNSTSLTTEPSAMAIAAPTTSLQTQNLGSTEDSDLIKFEALQYSLFSTSFVEVIGGIFFLITAAFIIKDKNKAIQSVQESRLAAPVSAADTNEISAANVVL